MDFTTFLLHFIFIGVFSGGGFVAGYLFAVKKLQSKKDFKKQT